MVDRVGYIQAYSFKYSRRAGTPAAVYPGQVPEKIKAERLNVLQEKLFSRQLNFNKECIGKIMPVLFESKGKKKGQLVRTHALHAESAGGSADRKPQPDPAGARNRRHRQLFKRNSHTTTKLRYNHGRNRI